MLAAQKRNEKLQENMTFGRSVSASYKVPLRRTALVMGGAGSSMGTAICKKMADMGHFVAATYHDEKQARAWQDRMEQEGYLFFVYEYDARGFEEAHFLVNNVIADLGPIQILVNNVDIDGIDSASYMTRAAIEGMLTTGFGRIINISSNQRFSLRSYAGIRRGIHGLTKALARQVASRGVTVNTVSPGYVATEMVLSTPKNMCGNIEAQIPAGRLGRPEDVAHIVSFLVSEESGFITGANIATNGGNFKR